MLPFQFKIKGYLNETGEYSQYFEAESGTIIQLILQHWFNESLPNNLDIVAINNSKGDQLVIDHVKRDIFDYYLFVNEKKKVYFHKKTDIQFMFFALECFFSHRMEDLKMNLTERDDDWRFIRGDFIGKNFTYAITRQSLRKNLGILSVPLFVFSVLIAAGLLLNPIVLIFAGIFLAIALSTTGPQLRIYRDYYLDNVNLEVRLSRADEYLHVKNGSGSASISKRDIRKIVKFIHPPEDVRNLAEYYTEIEFINGNVLNITCLLVPQLEIESKFANDPLEIETEIARDGRLKRRTKLDGYFSAISPGGRSLKELKGR